MLRRLFRWLYHWSSGRQKIQPMIEGPLMSRLIVTSSAISTGPRSALD